MEEFWDGFSTFWEEGFAPGATVKIEAAGTPRTRVMGYATAEMPVS